MRPDEAKIDIPGARRTAVPDFGAQQAGQRQVEGEIEKVSGHKGQWKKSGISSAVTPVGVRTWWVRPEFHLIAAANILRS